MRRSWAASSGSTVSTPVTPTVRLGRPLRVEIWYVIVDEKIVVTGTPGVRHWMANLRAHPKAVLHLREPLVDLEVTTHEITDGLTRRCVAEQAWHVQPWYAEQPYSIEDWVADSPMVVLTPTTPG